MTYNIPLNTLSATLDLLRIKHTKSYANKHFNEHPNKYNMLGLSEMLSHFKINNLGVRINNKEEILSLETPLIAHIGSDFVTVNKVTQHDVSYIWNGKKIITSLEEFTKSWSGATLLVEANEQSIEPNYKENRKKETFDKSLKLLLCLTTIVLASILFIENGIYKDIGLILLMLLNIAGVYVGYLLVLKQLHIQSNHADKICSLFSKSDCNNVLDSPAAKFLGVIGWSELGLSYFTANIIIILFTPHLLPFLTLLNICALPYSFWSVWYQKFKVKQWCPLCLVVQALFWSLFVANLLFGFVQIPQLTLSNILLVGVIYSAPFLIISLLLPRLSKSRKVERIVQEFNSFKMNSKVFFALLKERTHYDVDKNTSSILFGNTEATTLVTIFTNPHCGPCARMHRRVEELLSIAGDKLCVQYILSAFNEELEISNKYMISVFKQKDTTEMMDIYNKWFTEGKYKKEEFFELFKVDMENKATSEEHIKHTEWKEVTKLRATPTILVNGYELLNNYKIEDLVHVI